jgi:hypothetical protein
MVVRQGQLLSLRATVVRRVGLSFVSDIVLRQVALLWVVLWPLGPLRVSILVLW